MFSSPRQRWIAITIALVSVLVALGACSGSSSTTLPPTTGILVRAETLTSGRGCGRNPSQLFKYVIVVFGYSGSGDEGDRASYTQGVTSNVFDCYTDGAFIDLLPNAGNSSFRLEVFAYNEPAFTAASAAIEPFQGSVASTLSQNLKASSPTWTTECTATQQQDVQTLAVCDPLGAGLIGVGGAAPTQTQLTLPTGSFRLSDGRLATCATASDAGVADAADAAPDAALPDASDASADASSEGGTADAGATVTFTTVRIRYRLGATIGPTTDLPCPAVFLANVSPEPAAYTIDVGVLDSTGSPLGQTTCSVTSQTGATSTAVCPL